MPILRAMRLFNAIENNEFTSATLEALLADQGRRNELDAIAADRALMRRFAETAAASAVVLGSAQGRASLFKSTVAMESLLGSRQGRAAVFGTPAVVTALAASSVGMAIVGDSVICKMALSESALGLAAVLASATALAALRAASTYAVIQTVATGSNIDTALGLPGERYIALGASNAATPLNQTVTLKTMVASGSGVNTITLSSNDPVNASATVKPAAIGLRAPFTYSVNQNYSVALGFLRCDI